MSLTGKLSYTLTASRSSTRDLGAASVSESLSYSQVIADGDGANQAERVWGDSRSLAASATEEHDLAGGLTDGLGATITLTEVRALAVKASTANASTITLGGASSNAWEIWAGAAGDAIKLRPGGSLILIAPDATGYAVTGGSADLLKVANDSTSVTAAYDIFVLGSEA